MNDRTTYGLGEGELIGLDERPRPLDARARVRKGLAQAAPISSLQRRIILFNLVGLALLVLGVFYLNQFRSGLIEQRVRGLQTLAEVISVTVAERAALEGRVTSTSAEDASAVLARLVAPTGLRARLYDSSMTLVSDTRNVLGDVSPRALPSQQANEDNIFYRFVIWLESFYAPSVPSEREPTGRSAPGPGALSYDEELAAALEGQVSGGMRRNDRGQLIVAVAHPISEGARRYGVLLLSTEGEDINRIVRAERVAIIQVFVLAALVSVGLSILLANTIARPIRKLAAAVEGGRANPARPVGPERVQIPDMTRRGDEIGELSEALIGMTDALYSRIEAIESFASDVAHEIKNPLTSLRSAVETMQYAKTPEQRQRLLDVIAQDVTRMDRLVTDISNASRLDAELVRERMEPFDLGRLCEGLSGMFEDRAETHGVRLVLDLPTAPLMARGLEGRIGQVISNFIDNAISFSPEGGEVRLVARRLQDGGVGVGVMDDGPGVPPDNLESVFKRFYTERPESQGFGNHSGLGLAISRQIIEAHGGRIWVENREGPEGATGAHFRFELPE